MFCQSLCTGSAGQSERTALVKEGIGIGIFNQSQSILRLEKNDRLWTGKFWSLLSVSGAKRMKVYSWDPDLNLGIWTICVHSCANLSLGWGILLSKFHKWNRLPGQAWKFQACFAESDSCCLTTQEPNPKHLCSAWWWKSKKHVTPSCSPETRALGTD